MTDAVGQEAGVTADKPVSLVFTGTGSEYFRIWIVNIFLSIITLGIYSAWAKVRNARYFYGNTLLDNTSFEYHATPLQILKGRIIAIIFLAAYVITSSAFPLINLGLVVVLVLLMPWIIRQALRFKMAMSSYRGIRFSFRGGLGEAYGVYLILPFLGVLTGYLLWPWVHKRSSQYYVDHLSYGTADFKSELRTRTYYFAYVVAVLIVIVGLVLLAVVQAVLGGSISQLEDLQHAASLPPGLLLAAGLLPIALIAGFLAARTFVKVVVTNHVFDKTVLDGRVQLGAQLKFVPLFWIYLTNMIGIVLTLGLYIPWAKVRLMKYRVEQTQVYADTSLDGFVGEQLEQRSALGEELGDAFDIDVLGGI